MRALDGSSISVELEFLDEDDSPLNIKQGYPRVYVVDSDKNIITSTQASADANSPGLWTAVINIPMMGINAPTDFKLLWKAFETQTGQKYTHVEQLTVEPKVEIRDSDIVVLNGKTDARFIIPKLPDDGEFDLQLYSENKPLYPTPLHQDSQEVVVKNGKTRLGIRLTLPPDMEAALRPCLLTVECEVLERPMTYNYKVWNITPQIAVGMSSLEDFLNKARIENTIAELQWAAGDLVHYLERGLNMFNTIGTPTAFTGTNMMGQLYECWLLCSTYYAISAQLIAEGSLSFDFSGQGVSLNVDRTPQLDAALGRIEARIQDTVLPFKKLLAKTGNLSGDGSVGKGMLQNPYAFGTLNMINAPTTRIRGLSGLFIGRRN